MRGDVEKLSRGIGAPLISLKKEPHGVIVVAKVVIFMWKLMFSGVLSSNALIAATP